MGSFGRRFRLPGRQPFPFLAACGLLCIVGLGLAFWGDHYPPFWDEVAADQIFMDSCGAKGIGNRSWFEQLNRLRTPHDLWIDIGTGLFEIGASLAALYLGLFLAARGRPIWRTPTRRLSFVAIGIGINLLAWTATLVSFDIDMKRKMFSWCADAIIIPIMAITDFAFMLTVILVPVGVLTSLAFGRLPVSLFEYDPSRPRYSALISGVCGIAAFAVVASLVFTVPTSSRNMAPAQLFALYLILSTRAALLAPRPSATQ